jgi:hypothetical protein
MRVLYVTDPRAPGGFSYAERRTWRTVIFSNVISAMRQVIGAMEEFDLELEDENNIVHARMKIALSFSPIAIMYSRIRRSRIPKVSLDHIMSHCEHYGTTLGCSWQSAEGMNMHCMITYTSTHPVLRLD